MDRGKRAVQKAASVALPSTRAGTHCHGNWQATAAGRAASGCGRDLARSSPDADPRGRRRLAAGRVGCVLKFVWVGAPKAFSVVTGIVLGWIAVVALPQLAVRLNPAATVLLIVGGLLYTTGAIIYARRRPDPAPVFFGYHELFHAFTILAAACQYVAIAFFVIRVE